MMKKIHCFTNPSNHYEYGYWVYISILFLCRDECMDFSKVASVL